MFSILGFLDFTSVNRNTKLLWYSVEVLVLIFLGSIRWRTGSDWISYASYFAMNNTWEDFRHGGLEIGYAALSFLVKSVIPNYTAFLSVLILLTVGLKAYCFQQYTNYIFTSLLVYFCFFVGDIFAVRQALAISICIFGIGFIIDRKLPFFLLTVFTAFLIHNSAIIFLFAYWIFHLKISNKVLIFLIVGSIILGVSGILTHILAPLNFLFEIVGGETAQRMSSKLDFYKNNEHQGTQLAAGTILLIGIIRRSFFIPIYLIFRKRCEEIDDKYNGFLNLFIFGNIIYFVFASSILELVRSTIFYISSEVILLCIFLQSFKNLKIKIFVYWLVILYCALKLYYNLFANWNLYIPFNTIFDSNIERTTY